MTRAHRAERWPPTTLCWRTGSRSCWAPMAAGRYGMSPRSSAGRGGCCGTTGARPTTWPRRCSPPWSPRRRPTSPACWCWPGRRARQRARGPRQGRFAEQVANGGRQAAKSLGLRIRRVEAGDVSALLEATASRRSASLAEVALVVAGTFGEDVAVVRRVREARVGRREVATHGPSAPVGGEREVQAAAGPLHPHHDLVHRSGEPVRTVPLRSSPWDRRSVRACSRLSRGTPCHHVFDGSG